MNCAEIEIQSAKCAQGDLSESCGEQIYPVLLFSIPIPIPISSAECIHFVYANIFLGSQSYHGQYF